MISFWKNIFFLFGGVFGAPKTPSKPKKWGFRGPSHFLSCVVLVTYYTVRASTIIQCYHHNYFVGIMCSLHRLCFVYIGKKELVKQLLVFQCTLWQERMRELEKKRNSFYFSVIQILPSVESVLSIRLLFGCIIDSD